MIFENLEQNLNKWSIPKISPTKVYNGGVYDFKQAYIIKTLEKSMSVSNYTKSIALLTNKVIEKLKREYKYIHLGLV